VNFPIEGLDLSEYVLQNVQGGKKSGEYIYDLYAVSNHFGSLNGGHYTAFAKNAIDGKWYDFDDTDVSKIDA
jgi:ubiquitin carboxyl-terminal hydrolase 4/11/15